MYIVYDPTLVMLSILVAILGSLTGVAVTFGYGGARVVLSPQALVRGAVIIGGSIWSMHFIAMLAVKFPVAITYNSTQTLMSLCLAVLFTGVGLSLASAKALGPLKIPVAAVLMGSGIGAMHYLGMNAVTGCGITYDFNWVAVSLAVAVGASGSRALVCVPEARSNRNAFWRSGSRPGDCWDALYGNVCNELLSDYRCVRNRQPGAFSSKYCVLGCSGNPGYLWLLLIPVFVDVDPRGSVSFGEGRGRISW